MPGEDPRQRGTGRFRRPQRIPVHRLAPATGGGRAWRVARVATLCSPRPRSPAAARRLAHAAAQASPQQASASRSARSRSCSSPCLPASWARHLLSAIFLIRERARTAAENVELRARIADLNAALQRSEALLNLRDQRVIVWSNDKQEAGTDRHAAARKRRAGRPRRLPRLRPLADAALGGGARERGRRAARKGDDLRSRHRDRRTARRWRCRAARAPPMSSCASCRCRKRSASRPG